MTEPRFYPPADRTGAHWYQDTFGGARITSDRVLWHSTEGFTLPTYGAGASAPNLTFVPDLDDRKLRAFHHFDLLTSSRALRNLAGGVETNTDDVVQVELIGTCDRRNRTSWAGRRAGRDYIYWEDAPDWALKGLADFARFMRDEHGVPLQAPKLWLPYPASYGQTRARLSARSWAAFRGHLAHQHAPENVHGDVLFDVDRVFDLAGGKPATKPVAVKPVINLTNPDRGPRGAWPFEPHWLVGPDASESASWVDGTENDQAQAVVNAWRREFAPSGAAYFGDPGAPVDAAFVARAKRWQKAVGLPATGYLGERDWDVARSR